MVDANASPQIGRTSAPSTSFQNADGQTAAGRVIRAAKEFARGLKRVFCHCNAYDFYKLRSYFMVLSLLGENLGNADNVDKEWKQILVVATLLVGASVQPLVQRPQAYEIQDKYMTDLNGQCPLAASKDINRSMYVPLLVECSRCKDAATLYSVCWGIAVGLSVWSVLLNLMNLLGYHVFTSLLGVLRLSIKDSALRDWCHKQPRQEGFAAISPLNVFHNASTSRDVANYQSEQDQMACGYLAQQVHQKLQKEVRSFQHEQDSSADLTPQDTATEGNDDSMSREMIAALEKFFKTELMLFVYSSAILSTTSIIVLFLALFFFLLATITTLICDPGNRGWAGGVTVFITAILSILTFLAWGMPMLIQTVPVARRIRLLYIGRMADSYAPFSTQVHHTAVRPGSGLQDMSGTAHNPEFVSNDQHMPNGQHSVVPPTVFSV